MNNIVVRTDDINGFFSRAAEAAQRGDLGGIFDGKLTLSFEDPQQMCLALCEIQWVDKFKSPHKNTRKNAQDL